MDRSKQSKPLTGWDADAGDAARVMQRWGASARGRVGVKAPVGVRVEEVVRVLAVGRVGVWGRR